MTLFTFPKLPSGVKAKTAGTRAGSGGRQMVAFKLLCGELENFSILHQRVNFAIVVLGKAVYVVRLLEQFALRGDFGRVVIVAEPPDCAEVVVAVDIDAVEGGGFLAVKDVAADDAKADAVVGEQ